MTKKILVIEDDELFAHLLKSSLGKENYNVFLTNNTQNALHFIESNQSIELIICDIVLPEKSGTDIIDILNKKHHNIPIVFISNTINDNLIEKISNNKNYYFLAKPFKIAEVLKILKSI